MTQKELEGFWDSVIHILPFFISYAIGYAVISLCKFFDRHFGKDKFSVVKLSIGLAKDILFGLIITCGALWITHGNHFAAIFLSSIGILKGYKWCSSLVDKYLFEYGGLERRKKG